MKSTFIVMAAPALIRRAALRTGSGRHRLIAFRARESRRQCVRGYAVDRPRRGMARHLDRP